MTGCRRHIATGLVTACFLLLLGGTSEADTVRLLSYNIHHGRGSDGNIDLPRIAKIIRDSGPDLVALQEVDRKTSRSGGVDQLHELARLTGMHAAFGKAIDFGGGEYGVAVLSKRPLAKKRVHKLPTQAGQEPRVALEVETIAKGSDLRFVCTHFDHQISAVRAAQAKRLAELFQEGKQTILAGDFNAQPHSAALSPIRHAWRPADLVSLAPTMPANAPTRKIDYVFLPKAHAYRVQSTAVLEEPVASDHAPLLVEIAMERAPLPARLRPIATRAAWEATRPRLIRSMETILGPFPPEARRTPLDVEIVEVQQHEEYVQTLLTYASEPNCRTPAYLLSPKTPAPEGGYPAALCLHPTDNQVGHKVVVGLGGRPNRQYAQELTQRGYVTIAPAYPLLADYRPDWRSLGYVSGSMKAIWDNVRAVDLLTQLPDVNPRQIAAIGHSLGGHNAVYTAVYDARIGCVVSSCGLDRYRDYKFGDIRGWTGERYMPRLADYAHRLDHVPFEFDELIAALAPRPCFISAPQGDDNFRWKSVQSLTQAARRIYAFYDAGAKLQVTFPECGHDFPQEVREAAYGWIDQALGVR